MVVSLASMIEISDLSHIYGGKMKALDNLSFSVERGEVVGLLGPNGAGKSTAVKLITGILHPTTGSIKVAGFEVSENLAEVRRRIGFPKDEVSERVAKMLDLAGLTHRKNDRIKTYSGGMKRRLALVRTILHDSELLILDEMSLGVDVQSRNLIWNQVRRMREEGLTVLFCTNYMDEAEALADRVIVIDNGKLVAEGTPDGLKREYVGSYLIEVLLEGLEPENDASWLGGQLGMEAEKLSKPLDGGPRTAWIKSQAGHADLPLVIEKLTELGLKVKQASLREPSLGDVFLTITGSKLRD
jgi:ABC-2 type transport system ATP-binding protein